MAAASFMDHPELLAAREAADRGDWKEAERLLRAVIESASPGPHGGILEVHCLCALVRVLLPQGRFSEAEAALGRANELIDRLHVAGTRLHAAVLCAVAQLRLEEGKAQPASAILTRARQTFDSQPRGATDPLLFEIPHLQAHAAIALGRYADARQFLLEAIRMHEQHAAREPHRAAKHLIDLAVVQHNLGHLPEAAATLTRAMDHVSRAGSGAELLHCRALLVLGAVEMDQKQYDQAERHIRESLAISEPKLRPRHRLSLDGYNALGIVAIRQGRYSEAQPLFERVHEAEAAEQASAARRAITMNNLAVVYRELGKLQEAEAMQRLALQTQQQALGAQHPATANTLKNLALVLQRRGKPDEARQVARSAQSIAEAAFGADHPKTREIAAVLASLD